MNRMWPAVGFGTVLVLAPVPIAATGAPVNAEQTYIDRFTGVWQGSGTVEVPGLGALPVDCQAEAQPGPNHMAFGGTCRAALIFSRDFAADIAYEPATGVYAGTYVGARVGPANVVGR